MLAADGSSGRRPERRLLQEIVLGIGGVRALRRLGIQPTVFHMNQGHSALAHLDRIRLLMEEQHLSFPEAREAAELVASSAMTRQMPSDFIVASSIPVWLVTQAGLRGPPGL